MMDHPAIPHVLGMLVVILVTAKVGGALAQRIGQPAVLGELIGGVLTGPSLLGWVAPQEQALPLLAELGVLILLFAIGLETDLGRLLRVGVTSATVAVVGVVLPFVLGYLACRLLGLADLRAVMAAATLTATSVGITARALSDLGHLSSEEGQIILGAAVIDDVLGLLLLTVVEGLSRGQPVTAVAILAAAGRAVGFLAAAAVLGRPAVRLLFGLAERIELPGTVTVFAVVTALAMAWLADRSGSAMIVGAFAGGLLIAGMPRAREVERGITAIGHLLVPIFFVTVGAAVEIRALDPLRPAGRAALITGVVLIAVGVVGKLLAGYAPFWFRGSKAVVGVGMIPRGEVGLIFARIGRASGAFDPGLFGAATLMVIVTTLMAPPALKRLLDRSAPRPASAGPAEGIEDLATEA